MRVLAPMKPLISAVKVLLPVLLDAEKVASVVGAPPLDTCTVMEASRFSVLL